MFFDIDNGGDDGDATVAAVYDDDGPRYDDVADDVEAADGDRTV